MDKEDFKDEIVLHLKGAQESSSSNRLCNVNPEKWVKIAGELLAGKSPSKIRRENNWDYNCICGVKADIAGTLDRIKEDYARGYAEDLYAMREAKREAISRYIDSLENAEVTARDLKELSAAMNLDLGALSRLNGEATHKVEIEHRVTMDDVKKLREDALSRIKKADVVDVEEGDFGE